MKFAKWNDNPKLRCSYSAENNSTSSDTTFSLGPSPLYKAAKDKCSRKCGVFSHKMHDKMSLPEVTVMCSNVYFLVI